MNHKISLEEWLHLLEIKTILLATLVKNVVGCLKLNWMDLGD